MATNGSGSADEIIEKKASSPVATACLLIACLALLGAILFQVAEVAAYRTGPGSAPASVSKGVGQDMANKFVRNFRNDVRDVLDKSAAGSSDALDSSLSPEPEPMEEEEPIEEEPLEEEA